MTMHHRHALATGTLILTALLAACGGDSDDEGAGQPSGGSGSPSATTSASETAEPAQTALATTPTLVQCLVQDGLLAGGPQDSELPDGVVSQRIWLTLSDGSELDPVTGALHVLADEAEAAAYADQLLAREIEDEEVPGDTATASVHANVVAVLEADPGDTSFAATYRGCLPGADPATAVRPPTEGTATLASLMECAETVGMSGFGEHSYFDISEGKSGSVLFRTPNDFGGYDEQATVYVFPDAATAESREKATIGDQEARLFERHGNTIVRFLDSLDAGNPVPDQVRGCLPG